MSGFEGWIHDYFYAKLLPVAAPCTGQDLKPMFIVAFAFEFTWANNATLNSVGRGVGRNISAARRLFNTVFERGKEWDKLF